VDRIAASNDVRILDLGLHAASDASTLNAETVVGDVRDPDVIEEFVDGADVLIHLASIAGVQSVLSHPVDTAETTLLGTHNVLRAVASRNVRRVVIFSTSEVAGRFAYNAAESATMSGASVDELRWIYAATKLAGEFTAAAYHAQFGVPTVCLRPFNIYGPGQLGSGAVREFCRAAVRGKQLTVRGEGAQIRAWCYIDDVVECVDLACTHDAAVGKVFNVGNPRSVVTVSELAKLVVRLAESNSAIEYVPTTEVDVELRVPDISRARALLGFEPNVDLDEGLLRSLDWYRS
jgi:nucleoside-diphosphate-sugar epimerase